MMLILLFVCERLILVKMAGIVNAVQKKTCKIPREGILKCLLLVLLFFVFPFFASADSQIKDIIESLIEVFQLIAVVVFTLAVMMFGWGIAKLIIASSQGPEELKKAKGIITWGIIAMFVLASLMGIVAWIRGYLGISPDSSINVPQFNVDG